MEQRPGIEGAALHFGLVGKSPEIDRVLRVIHKLRHNRWPVLVLGESGTGKELVARALHKVAPGPRGVFLPVDVPSLPAELVESELFGHAEGSFTGARRSRAGLIHQADGGTLFLDEIGELPAGMQAKLLRFLQEQEIRPVGVDRPIPVDVRVIAATNRDLTEEVRRGRFRLDLYHRLNVLQIELPPLGSHKQDIPLLVEHFLARHATRPLDVPRDVLDQLMGYDWPGNVRELEHCIMRMAVLATDCRLDAEDLPPGVLRAAQKGSGSPDGGVIFPARAIPLAEIEMQAIQHALKLAGGNYAKAAKLLGIGKTTLYRKLKKMPRGTRELHGRPPGEELQCRRAASAGEGIRLAAL